MQELHRIGGNGDSTPGGPTQGFMRTEIQGKAVTPQEPGPDLPVGLGGSPGEAGVDCGSLWGQGRWWWRPRGIFISVSSPGGRHFGTETWPHPTTCRLHCGDASSQTTNRVGTHHHPSADRLPKVILSPQPSLNTPLDMALPTRGKRPSSTHQWAGTSPSHQEACTNPWTNLTHQGADTRS